MNIYDIFMYPLERIFLDSMRKKMIPHASGDVIEIGAGTGVNFRYYNSSKIESITVVDKKINSEAKKRKLMKMDFILADATKLPFDDNSFDTVVETLLLCSIDEIDKALEEIYRVLKPEGVFIHIDHGIPDKKGLKKIFNGFAPIWRFFSRSCRINKEFEPLLYNAEFKTFEELKNGWGIFYGGMSKKRKE